MTELIPSAPPGWRVIGCLRDAEYSELLTNTMVEIHHQSGDVLIYAGWTPEEDPAGHYVVGAIRDCQLIGSEKCFEDMRSTAEYLRKLCRDLHPVIPTQVFAGWGNLNREIRTSSTTSAALNAPKLEFEVPGLVLKLKPGSDHSTNLKMESFSAVDPKAGRKRSVSERAKPIEEYADSMAQGTVTATWQ